MLKNLCVVFLLVASLAFGQGVISPRQIRQAGATSGQCLKWNGSIWAPGDCVTSGGAWGGITGTLGDQTDLVTALGLRLLASNNLSDLGNAATARTNLGLGNVDNYATASQAEAEAATATDKFMTPERVSQLLDAFDVLRYAKRGNDPTAGCTDNRIYIDEDVGVPEEAFVVCRDSAWHIVGGFSVSTLLNKSGRELSLDSSVVRFTEGAGDPSGVCVQGQELYLNSSSGIYWRCKVSTGTWEALVDATSTQTLTNKTMTTPTIASFTNAGHTHADAAGGGTLNASAIAAGTIAPARLGSGTPSASTVLYGDSSWGPAPSGGSGTAPDPYTATVSAQTTLTVTEATHGQGTNPAAFCYDNSTPRVAVACNYSKASDGQIVFTWSPAFTGQVAIMAAGSGSAPEPYTATVSAQTTLTVAAATHAQGADPIAQCFDNSTPRIAVACSYSKASDGQIVFTWSPAFTGQVIVMSSGRGAPGIGATPLTSGTSITLTGPRAYAVCTAACSVTLPTPDAGVEFCARNANNTTGAISLVNISGVQYEAPNRLSYYAANRKLVSGGAATDQICVLGLDSTHYMVMSYTGTWTDTAP